MDGDRIHPHVHRCGQSMSSAAGTSDHDLRGQVVSDRDQGNVGSNRQGRAESGRSLSGEVLKKRGRNANFSLLRRIAVSTVGRRPFGIADDRLRLIFTCCHPALPPEGQAALTLREICGLTWLKKMQWLSISVFPNNNLLETNLNRRKKCYPQPILSFQPNFCSTHKRKRPGKQNLRFLSLR